jgi:hypothetical protein
MTENDRAVRYSEMLESWAATTSRRRMAGPIRCIMGTESLDIGRS